MKLFCYSTALLLCLLYCKYSFAFTLNDVKYLDHSKRGGNDIQVDSGGTFFLENVEYGLVLGAVTGQGPQPYPCTLEEPAAWNETMENMFVWKMDMGIGTIKFTTEGSNDVNDLTHHTVCLMGCSPITMSWTIVPRYFGFLDPSHYDIRPIPYLMMTSPVTTCLTAFGLHEPVRGDVPCDPNDKRQSWRIAGRGPPI